MQRLIVREGAGAEIEIDADAFDAGTHTLVRTVEATPATPATPVDAAEPMDMEAFGRAVGAALAPTLEGQFSDALKRAGAGVPVQTPAVAAVETTRAAGSAARAVPVWAGANRYAALPEGERLLRSPDVDQGIASYMRAVAAGDYQGKMAALESLDGPAMARSEHQRLDLAVGGAATGGNIVPVPMANIIVEKRQQMEVIGPRARQFTSPNQALDVPVEAVLMTAAVIAEADPITQADPTWGQVNMVKAKVATTTTSSAELLEFTPFDLVSHISRQAAAAIARKKGIEDAAGTAFTDSLLVSSAIIATTTTATMSEAELMDLVNAVPMVYRAGSFWIANEDTIGLMGSQLDANGRQFFQPLGAEQRDLGGAQGGLVGSMLGYSVLAEDGMTAGLAVFGNLDFYGRLGGGAMRVETSRDVLFLNDQIAWKFVEFADGAVLQGEAFTKNSTAWTA